MQERGTDILAERSLSLRDTGEAALLWEMEGGSEGELVGHTEKNGAISWEVERERPGISEQSC